MFFNNIEKKIIKENLEKINKFCIEKKIPCNTESFFTYKEKDDFVPNSIRFWFGLSKYLLVSSSSFESQWRKLDEDFKVDLFTNEQEKAVIENELLYENKNLYKFLKKILKNDFRWA